jgi:hypothetical protein
MVMAHSTTLAASDHASRLRCQDAAEQGGPLQGLQSFSGQEDRAAAETEEGAAVLMQDMAGGQGCDDAELPGVEQDK